MHMNPEGLSRVRRLVAWVHKNRRDLVSDGSPSAGKLAAATGKKVQYWSDVLRERAKSFGTSAAREAEESLGMPRYFLEGLDLSQHPSRGVAHSLSEIRDTLTPITIDWGVVVSMPELPPRFALQVKDRAMEGREARGLRPGDLAHFATGRQPEPGEVVLVADRDGNLYIRTYHERRPGHWQAVAASPHVQPLDSEADGLRVLAVQCGHTWG